MRRPFPHLVIFPILLVLACVDPTQRSGSDIADTGADHELVAIEQRILDDPANAALYIERAQLNRLRGRFAEAIEDHRRALTIDSANADYRIGLGDLYYTTLKVDAAREQFELALKIDPESNIARLKMAEMRMMQRQYEQAMALVNEALRSDPGLAQGYFLKGWMHMETGDTALAISSFRTSVERDPSNYKGFMQLGLLHAYSGDPLALQYYSTATELRPEEVEAWYNKGMFAQENGMDSLALDCYKRIRDLDPGNATAWYNSGYVRLEHLNDVPQAIRDFTAATKLLPGYYQAWYNRGLAYERKGVMDSAAMDYREALRLEPGYDPAARGMTRLETKGLRVVRP